MRTIQHRGATKVCSFCVSRVRASGVFALCSRSKNVYRDDDYKIIHAWAGIAGQGGIRPDVFYTLGADGKPVEVTP
jgi:hypothetical protein